MWRMWRRRRTKFRRMLSFGRLRGVREVRLRGRGVCGGRWVSLMFPRVFSEARLNWVSRILQRPSRVFFGLSGTSKCRSKLTKKSFRCYKD